MRVLKKGNSNTKSSAYTSLARPIRKYGGVLLGPYREGRIDALDWVQKKAAKFAHRTNDSVWETLAQCRKCALYKAFTARYKDHANWAGMTTIVKLRPENKEQISANNHV